MTEYRFLTNIDFDSLYDAFVEAFSDYFVPLHLLTKDQLREMFTRRGANLKISVGAFDDERLAGFNLNACDDFYGKRTVYDVATGVIPSHRRKGIAKGMFEFSLPTLRSTNAEQYILEAIEKNQAAIATYKGVGFEIYRKFDAFRRPSSALSAAAANADIDIQQVKPDWNFVQKFWDWLPSWQNSIASIERSRGEKVFLSALSGSRLVGYCIVYLANGDIPQFAVDRDYRRKGIASALLHAAQKILPVETAARVVNIEATDASTLNFLRATGFENLLSQYEMKLNFTPHSGLSTQH